MSFRRRRAVLVTLSLAAALTLTALAVGPALSRPAMLPVSAANVPTDIRRSVVWYGVPESAPRTFHIESSSIGAATPDEFQISYAAGNLTLVYQRVAGGPITTQYTLNAHALLEWNDTQGDGHPEDGTMVEYTLLGPSAFGRFPVQHSATTTADGVHVNSFLIPGNRGELAINLTIADGFVTLPSGQVLTPMEAKLTFEIYHNMTLPDTRLSLQIGMTTNQVVPVLENRSWDDMNEFSSDDHAVNVTNDAESGPSTAFFAWSDTASVNGQTGAVAPSGPSFNETTGDYDIYLSYARPASGDLQLHVVHDPTMGVVSAAYASILHPGPGSPLPFESDALVYGVSLGTIAALVALTAFLVGRRRRKQS